MSVNLKVINRLMSLKPVKEMRLKRTIDMQAEISSQLKFVIIHFHIKTFANNCVDHFVCFDEIVLFVICYQQNQLPNLSDRKKYGSTVKIGENYKLFSHHFTFLCNGQLISKENCDVFDSFKK